MACQLEHTAMARMVQCSATHLVHFGCAVTGGRGAVSACSGEYDMQCIGVYHAATLGIGEAPACTPGRWRGRGSLPSQGPSLPWWPQ